MFDPVPTVRIVSSDPASQGAFIIINASDFDPEIHTEYVEPPVADGEGGSGEGEGAGAPGELTKADIANALTDLKVEFKLSASKPELMALLVEAQAKAAEAAAAAAAPAE